MDEPQVPFRGFARGRPRFTLSAIERARHFAKSGTRVVLAAHPNLAFPASWMQRASPGLKIVVMSHGIEVWEPLPLLRRRALLRSNLVLAPSIDTAQKLIDVQGVPSSRVRVLAWPLNPGFLRMAAAPVGLPVLPSFPHGRIIVTVGRWVAAEQYKGADELIRTIPRLCATIPDLHLVLVGNGDDLPRLRSLAADLSVVDRVHFLENLSREEIAGCYARADVFALPSTGEGFGLVFLEAMAFAKPVVGVACGGTTDLIEDGVNGLLLPPRKPERLTQALERLLHDKSLRTIIGQRGAEIVRQKYRFETFRDSLEKILDDAVAGTQPVAR